MNIDIPYALGIIKDVILIIGSITATSFAFITFNKWKREHSGKLKYELLRNVLKTTYTLRDDFASARNPFVHGSEFMPNYDPKGSNQLENTIYVLNNRLKYLQTTYNDLLSLLGEIELEFGKETRNICHQPIRQINNYRFKVDEFIQLDGNSNNDEYLQELRKIVYAIGANNPTTLEFERVVSEIDKEVQRLKKKY